MTKPVAGSRRRFLMGPQHKLALRSASSPESGGPITLTLALRRRAPVPALDDMARRMPAERQYLTLGDIAQTYGATDEDLARIGRFAGEAGLAISESDPHAAVVRLSGSPEAVGSAFQLQEENGFLVSSVPVELGDAVRWIFGFDGRRAARSTTTVPRPVAPEAPSPSTLSEEDPLAPVSYTAPEVARLYEYPPLQGEGQCLGILALTGGYREDDMAAYFRELGISRPEIIDVGAHFRSPSWIPNAEVTQNIQLAAAVCPRARIVVYHAHSASIQDYFHVLRAAIFDAVHKPSVLSVSWSFPELEGLGPTPEEAELFDELFRLAALLGITICSSCGDHGSVRPVFQQNTPTLATAASFAATSPHVLGCGGTTLYARGASIEREVVWNRLQELALWHDPEPARNLPFSFSMATGGGISRMFPLPEYQRGAHVPPAIIRHWRRFTLLESRTFSGRGTPDVAANADMLTGYRIRFEGQPSLGGGTSAAAPMWAALVILINEGLSRNHGPQARVGWLNPLLYSLALSGTEQVVRRISEGSNGGYAASAHVPWNACTGLGSPRGMALAQALGAWPVPGASSGREPGARHDESQ